MNVNDYIRFERSIYRNAHRENAYGPRGGGIVTKVNKTKKVVKSGGWVNSRVIGRHRVARVYAGPVLGHVTAIVDEGTFEVTGVQGVLQGMDGVQPMRGNFYDRAE